MSSHNQTNHTRKDWTRINIKSNPNKTGEQSNKEWDPKDEEITIGNKNELIEEPLDYRLDEDVTPPTN